MMGKLTVRGVGAAKAGKYGDGSGLYLFVTENGAKRWVFRYKRNGASTSREMGLGSVADVGLAEAREKAANARKAVREGRDPIAERTRTSNVPNFGELASEVHESRSTGFRNKKHAAQWISTLRTDAAPMLAMPVDTIGTHDVLGVLQPIWKKKSETASRVRGRIEAVLDYAKAKGLRDGENPARWRGHLDQLLPKRPKLTRGHHAAMPHEQVAAFVGCLRESDGLAARALELCIMTAARSGEILGMQWLEIDLGKKIWTVPAQRMKAGREHRVPLSARAVAILKQLRETKAGDFVFSGQARGKPLSGMAMEMLLRRMKIENATPHGFRSSFRDWSSERTNFSNEVCEAALAHVIRNKAEAAYRRGDLLEKRRKLMDAWANYCESGSRGKIVPLVARHGVGR